MARTCFWCSLLTAIVMAASINVQGPAIADDIGRPQDQRPVTGSDALPSGKEPRQPVLALGQPLLAAIEGWLAFQFALPSVGRHPRIELLHPAKIAALRHQGFIPNSGGENAPNRRPVAATPREVVAVYSDATQTIYLAEGWTGTTPGELSVLVHEMVHHLQNMGGHKYECPQGREQLAYLAQDRWLGLLGHSLEQDFELDAFSILVKTKCMY